LAWLGGRDSNPDTQIQSSFEGLPDQWNQSVAGEEQGEVGQNPQHGRKYGRCYADVEEETLP
jgi:hypothetical protein